MPFKMVQQFQKEVLKRDVSEKGLLTEDELTLIGRQLREEVGEIEQAHDDMDFIGAIDGHIDLIYFAIGGLHRLGLSPEEMHKCFEAVHEANMTKKKGLVQRDGVHSDDDAAKPEEWVGPEERIAAILGAETDVRNTNHV